MEKVSLYEFFNGDKNKKLVSLRDDFNCKVCTFFIKVDSGADNIDLVYKMETKDNQILPAFKDMEFIGFYEGVSNILYYYYFSHNFIESLNCENITLVQTGELYTEVKEHIVSEVVNKVNYDETFLGDIDLSEDELDRIKSTAKSEAYELFMKNEMVDINKYTQFVNIPDIKYSDEFFISYLQNPDKFAESEANKHIEESRKHIYTSIIRSKLTSREMRELEKDKSLHKKREIYNILNNQKRKTLNIELERDKKILKCKITTNSRYFIESNINSFDIVDRKDREVFKEMFKDSREYADFKYINKITYSRKTLYEEIK